MKGSIAALKADGSVVYEPAEYEDRPTFLKRLRRTVTWFDEDCHKDALKLCTNQKQRVRAVQKLSGARSKW